MDKTTLHQPVLGYLSAKKNHYFWRQTAITHNNPRNLLCIHDQRNAGQRAEIRLGAVACFDVRFGLPITPSCRFKSISELGRGTPEHANRHRCIMDWS